MVASFAGMLDIAAAEATSAFLLDDLRMAQPVRAEVRAADAA